VSANPDDPSARIASLQAELEAVRRREAEFRAKMVTEFLDRGERNTYLHTLREERAALVKREQEASADLETLTRKLEAELARSSELAGQLAKIRRSWIWRLFMGGGSTAASHFPKAPPPAPSRAEVEGAPFTYFLHTSPFRIYRERTFTLRGWAWPNDGRSVTAIRVNLEGRNFDGRTGLPEPEVIARYGPQAANPNPGFEVTFETTPGRRSLSLEAQLAGSDWRSIMRTTIWCEPPST
jgi:hypothetical protein